MSSVSDAELVAERARQVVSEHDPESVPIPEFLAACYDAGLSWVHFPEGMGGLGVSRGLQAWLTASWAELILDRAVLDQATIDRAPRVATGAS